MPHFSHIRFLFAIFNVFAKLFSTTTAIFVAFSLQA